MKKTKPKELSGVAKLLDSKRKLVLRLRGEIVDINANTERAVAKVESRIRIAQALISALEKGTLKP